MHRLINADKRSFFHYVTAIELLLISRAFGFNDCFLWNSNQVSSRELQEYNLHTTQTVRVFFTVCAGYKIMYKNPSSLHKSLFAVSTAR